MRFPRFPATIAESFATTGPGELAARSSRAAPPLAPFPCRGGGVVALGQSRYRSEPLLDQRDRRPLLRDMGIERAPHGREMRGRRAAAAADDAGAGIAGEPRIVGHQFRGAGIVDVPVMIFGDAAIAL